MRISDWSSDVCSSDLLPTRGVRNDKLHRHGWRQCPQPGDQPENDDRKTAFDDEARAQQRLRPWRVLFLARLRKCRSGRASCRERVCQYVSISLVPRSFKKQTDNNIQRVYYIYIS